MPGSLDLSSAISADDGPPKNLLTVVLETDGDTGTPDRNCGVEKFPKPTTHQEETINFRNFKNNYNWIADFQYEPYKAVPSLVGQ